MPNSIMLAIGTSMLELAPAKAAAARELCPQRGSLQLAMAAEFANRRCLQRRNSAGATVT